MTVSYMIRNNWRHWLIALQVTAQFQRIYFRDPCKHRAHASFLILRAYFFSCPSIWAIWL